MRQGIISRHCVDGDGLPAGGTTTCREKGMLISWQDGPMLWSKTKDEPVVAVPNGAFVEDVIDACIDRLRFYQRVCNGKFACDENAAAIVSLGDAVGYLDDRTERRLKASTVVPPKGDYPVELPDGVDS